MGLPLLVLHQCLPTPENQVSSPLIGLHGWPDLAPAYLPCCLCNHSPHPTPLLAQEPLFCKFLPTSHSLRSLSSSPNAFSFRPRYSGLLENATVSWPLSLKSVPLPVRSTLSHLSLFWFPSVFEHLSHSHLWFAHLSPHLLSPLTSQRMEFPWEPYRSGWSLSPLAAQTGPERSVNTHQISESHEISSSMETAQLHCWMDLLSPGHSLALTFWEVQTCSWFLSWTVFVPSAGPVWVYISLVSLMLVTQEAFTSLRPQHCLCRWCGRARTYLDHSFWIFGNICNGAADSIRTPICPSHHPVTWI